MKITGMIMITLFSSSLGFLVIKSKKEQILYIDNFIKILQKVILLLKTTIPDTSEIIDKISDESKRLNFDKDKQVLKNYEQQRITEFYESIGAYDTDTQINLFMEYYEYFKMLKKQYQEYYNTHYRLYIMLGIFSGIAVSVLLI